MGITASTSFHQSSHSSFLSLLLFLFSLLLSSPPPSSPYLSFFFYFFVALFVREGGGNWKGMCSICLNDHPLLWSHVLLDCTKSRMAHRQPSPNLIRSKLTHLSTLRLHFSSSARWRLMNSGPTSNSSVIGHSSDESPQLRSSPLPPKPKSS